MQQARKMYEENPIPNPGSEKTVTRKKSEHFHRVTALVVVLSLLFLPGSSSGQSITEIITDYLGFWKSGSSSLNPLKPNNNHNLLAFSFSGTRYSTGVNDALLASRGQTFVPGDYRALPVQSISGATNSNTKVGVGAMYDGILAGVGNVPPPHNIPYYLTDGVKGLNIGTCIANLPAGTLFFSVGNINPSAIGDGIPDVVITQTADPSTSFDRYEFTTVSGNRVGNYKDIVLNSISPVGRWDADFYEAITNPLTLTLGFTNTERPIRLWAADFSEFGINATSISSIAYFKIILSGTSDVAFVAYNHNAINFSSVLPVQLADFTASMKGDNGVLLNWQTFSEANSNKFLIEHSTDGIRFSTIGEIPAAGQSETKRSYSFIDKPITAGVHYYRLKEIDLDGNVTYSKVVKAHKNSQPTVVMYPNPATDYVVIRHSPGIIHRAVRILTPAGQTVSQAVLYSGMSELRLSVKHLSKGIYHLVIDGDTLMNKHLVIE